MTGLDAVISGCRARWAHPPLDRRDVEERVALRGLEVEVVVQVHATAVRLFVRRGDGWRSRYVHELHDVDGALDALRGGP